MATASPVPPIITRQPLPSDAPQALSNSSSYPAKFKSDGQKAGHVVAPHRPHATFSGCWVSDKNFLRRALKTFGDSIPDREHLTEAEVEGLLASRHVCRTGTMLMGPGKAAVLAGPCWDRGDFRTATSATTAAASCDLPN